MYIGFIGFCKYILTTVNELIAIPALLLFLSTALILTLKTRFLQFRAIPRAWHILTGRNAQTFQKDIHTLSPLRALFSSMAATVGMGNIVGPPMAIALGGPGALFWMIIYIMLGTITKCVEISFAVYARKVGGHGDIIGGPSQYLNLVFTRLGTWYAMLTAILFTAWSSIQVNTLTCIWAQEGIPSWLSGLVAVSILLWVVLGGVQRIGLFASYIVPIKVLFYIVFAVIILATHYNLLWDAIQLVATCSFTRPAMCGGLAGTGILVAMRQGVYKSIFVTEAGLGTASIAHALTEAQKPLDQGVLAIFSAGADILLCSISGLLTLVTRVWTTGSLSNTLIYEIFKNYSPFHYTQYFLLIAILLFVLTALVGNIYNGSQSIASLFGYRYVKLYFFGAACISFLGSFATVPVIWAMLDILLVFVAIPNLIGIVYLAYKYPHVLQD